MIQLTKKISLLALVLGVSSLGVTVGSSLTHHVFRVNAAWAAPSAPATPTGQQDRYENLELFQKVLHFVEANYVDGVKNKDLVYGAIKGMLETLDPHSNFLPPDVFKDMKIDTSGEFGGLGIEIGMKDNILTVISPIEDTPAWKAGLKPNDRIVKIGTESTKGMTLTEAVSKMRGKKGTSVILSVYREGFEKIKEIPVTRDKIKIQAVKSEQLENGFGYVRLASFNEHAAQDVRSHIDKLNNKYRLKGLVFDLRMNPGGLLDQAVEVSSLFIDGSQASEYNGVIVSTIGRNRDQKEVKYAKKGTAYKDFPVAVLVNSSTASAAEIVAGALQDYKRGIIMGQQTFGKGSVQTVIELGPEMGLKLTIARYYTPSGRSIQEKGVTPDVILDEYDPKLLAEARRKSESFREKDLKGHMANPDGEEAKDFKKEELESIGKKKGDKSDKSKEDDDMAPMKFNPKEDYQVREALGFLKSYEVFKKIAASEKPVAPAQKTASQ
jgi:carboxyl-terminal processing protease